VTGALVSRIADDGPARRSGIARGELVTQVDGHAVRSARDFYEMLESATPGQDVTLSIWRSGKSETAALRAQTIPEAEIRAIGERLLGLKLRGQPRGGFSVESVRPQSGAARIGLRAGDFLLGVNGRELANDAAMRRAILDLRGRPQALLVVQRGPGRYHVTVPLG
jgi:serine protease Do